MRKVSYTIDGRRLRSARTGRFGAVLGPKQLRRLGRHRLVAKVRPRKGKARRIVLRIKTVPCQTLFTAQRWRTTAGQGLRVRVDALSAIRGLSFKVPAALLPRQGAKSRTIGFARFFIAGRAAPVKFNLKLPRKGRRTVLLAAASGRPGIDYRRGRLTVTGFPDRTAVAEITHVPRDQAGPRHHAQALPPQGDRAPRRRRQARVRAAPPRPALSAHALTPVSRAAACGGRSRTRARPLAGLERRDSLCYRECPLPRWIRPCGMPARRARTFTWRPARHSPRPSGLSTCTTWAR